MKRRSLLMGGGALLATQIAAPFRATAQGKTGKLVVATASSDPSFCALHVANKKGWFKDHDLEVEIIDGANDARVRQMIAAGQAEIAFVGAYNTALMEIAGKPADTIATISKRIHYTNVLVHKDNYDAGRFRRIKDIAGEKFGVSAPKTGLAMMATYMASHAGLKEIEFRYLGDLPSILAGLKSKQVAACMATLFMLEAAVGQGWAVPIVQANDDATLKDAVGEEGDIPGQTIIALRSTSQGKQKEIQSFMNGFTKAVDFAFATEPKQIADLVGEAYKGAIEPDSLVKQIGIFKQSIWSRDNMFTPANFTRTVDVMRDGQMITAAEAAMVKYENNADMSFVKQSRKL